MKRYRRIISLAIAALCLLLMIAICGTWFRSRHTMNRTEFSLFQRSLAIQSGSGGLIFRVTNLKPTTTSVVGTGGMIISAGVGTITIQAGTVSLGAVSSSLSKSISTIHATAASISIQRIRYQGHGFEWSSGFTATNVNLTLPGTFSASQFDEFTLSNADALIVLMIIGILSTYLGIRTRTSYDDGLCAKCGYDLRATPDRCPECGTIPPKKEAISN